MSVQKPKSVECLALSWTRHTLHSMAQSLPKRGQRTVRVNSGDSFNETLLRHNRAVIGTTCTSSSQKNPKIGNLVVAGGASVFFSMLPTSSRLNTLAGQPKLAQLEKGGKRSNLKIG